MTRRAYAHDAVVLIEPGGDVNALGGAIANALCGTWDHPPPCPLAPHHVASRQDGGVVVVRVLFATEPANEERVRSLIDEALAAGELVGPDGRITVWQLKSTAVGCIRPGEEEHAAGLVAG